MQEWRDGKKSTMQQNLLDPCDRLTYNDGCPVLFSTLLDSNELLPQVLRNICATIDEEFHRLIKR